MAPSRSQSAIGTPEMAAQPGVSLRGVARSGTFAAVGTASGSLLGLVFTLVVTHGLDTTTAGQFFSATAVFLVLQTFLSFGVGAGMVRFIPRYRALGRAADIPKLLLVAFVPVALTATAGSVALWLASGSLAERIGHDHASDVAAGLRTLAVLLLFGTLEVAIVECTRGFGSIRSYVVIQQVSVPLLRPILVVIAIAVDAPFWGVVLAWMVPLIVALMLAGGIVAGELRRSYGSVLPNPQQSTSTRAIAAEYWSFTAARGSAGLMEILLNWLDVLLVAALTSPAVAAVYAAASRFVTSGTLVLQALRLAIAADISAALARRDTRRVSEMYRVASQWVVLSSWPLYLTMAIFAPTVLQIFGRSYSAGATALTILCLAMLVNLAAGNVGTVLLMGGRSTWVLADKGTCLALNVALNLLLVPHIGMTGAAIAWAATIVFDSALAFGQVRWGMGIDGSMYGLLLSATVAVTCFGVVPLAGRVVFGSSWRTLIVSVVVASMFYGVLCWRGRHVLALTLLSGSLRPRRRSDRSTGSLITSSV